MAVDISLRPEYIYIVALLQRLLYRKILVIMATGQLTKLDILARVLKLKNQLYGGGYGLDWDTKQKEAADKVLSDVIDVLNEYRY